MKLPCLPITVAFSVLVWTLSAVAAEPQWTRFRGPNGCGVGEAPSIPAAWTDADYRWKAKLPGIGLSSPRLDDRLYVTSTLEDQSLLVVLCLKTANGSVLWKRSFGVKPHTKLKQYRRYDHAGHRQGSIVRGLGYAR